MDVNQFLVSALENVLGKSVKKSKGNFAFICPWCHHRKPKLEINLDSDSPNFQCWECWVCQKKGRTIRNLLTHLRYGSAESADILQFVKKGNECNYTNTSTVALPDEFKSLELASKSSIVANRYRNYLYNRGLSDIDFIRYGIGYCNEGPYENRVVIPSYDSKNCLNYFIARSLDSEAYQKYANPPVSKDIIFWENLINWNEPVILVEGVFDAFAVRRNVTPLLGKHISNVLLKKIIENPVPEVYMCLDRDALSASLKHCETFLSVGKKVYLVVPEKKDPGEQGFRSITEQLQSCEELTFKNIVQYKISL